MTRILASHHQKRGEGGWGYLPAAVLSYLRASSVRLFPLRPPLFPSGVFGPESNPPDPNLLSLAEARFPDVSLVADMIS